MQQPCPNCGYCPCCGRSNPVYPQTYPVVPYIPANPYPWNGGIWVTCETPTATLTTTK